MNETYAQSMREGHSAAWSGRWREAVGFYRRAVDALPDDVAARSSLAAALAHGGSPAEALQWLEPLAQERADDTSVLLRVAELRHRVGRADAGDDAYLRAAGLYQAAGQQEKALGVWRKLLHLSSHRGSTMTRLAEAAMAAGADEIGSEARRLAAAVPATTTAKSAAHGPASLALVGAIEVLAANLRQAGAVQTHWTPPPAPDVDGAVGVDDALIGLEAAPDDLRGARRLGLTLIARGKDAAGMRQLRHALDAAEVSGDLALAVALLGDLLSHADDPIPLLQRQARLALLGEAVEAAAVTYLAIGEHLHRRGDGAAALTEVRRARAVAPMSAGLQAKSATWLAKLGQTQEAADAWRRAFQLAPRESEYLARYASAAARRGDAEELTIALDALVETKLDPRVVAAVVDQELGGASVPVALMRGALRTAVGDDRGVDDLRAASRGPAPLAPRAALMLGERLVSAGRGGEVLTELRLWLPWSSSPDSGEAGPLLAGLALSAADSVGDAELAIAALRALAARDPADRVAGSVLAERLSAAGQSEEAAAELARLADLAAGQGEADVAGPLLEAAAALDARFVLAAAENARGRGLIADARRLFLLAAEGGGPALLAPLLAAADLSTGSSRIDVLRRAIAVAPDEPAPRGLLVSALIGAGQVGLAADEAAALARAQLRRGDIAGARAAADQVRRLDPWHGELQALDVAVSSGGS